MSANQPSTPTAPTDACDFRAHAGAVMTRLRNSLRGVLSGIPGDSPKDLQTALDINYKLAWQIHRIASSSEPLDEAGHVPGNSAIVKFLESAQRQTSASSDRLEHAYTAVAEFENLVTVHAGDRATFDAMISGLTGDAAERVDLNQRKAAFRANSHIWGVQVKARMACIILQPNDDDDDFIDMVMVRGVVGLKQLRVGRPFVISSVRHLDNGGEANAHVGRQQLNLDDAVDGINLLGEYCSTPLPEIRNRITSRGVLITEIVNRDIGTTAAFTGFLCDIFSKADRRYRNDGNVGLTLGSTVHYPVEVNVTDIFVRRDTFGDGDLHFRSESRSLANESQPGDPNPDVLFADNSVAPLGRGTDSLHSSDNPRYVEMIADVMSRLGWHADTFDAYRHRLMYPVMPSAVVTLFDLPAREA